MTWWVPHPGTMTVRWQVTAKDPFEPKLLWVYKKLHELTWIKSDCRKSYWWIKGQLSQVWVASSCWMIRDKSWHNSHWCFLSKKEGAELSIYYQPGHDFQILYCHCRKVAKYPKYFLMILILIIANIGPSNVSGAHFGALHKLHSFL